VQNQKHHIFFTISTVFVNPLFSIQNARWIQFIPAHSWRMVGSELI